MGNFIQSYIKMIQLLKHIFYDIIRRDFTQKCKFQIIVQNEHYEILRWRLPRYFIWKEISLLMVKVLKVFKCIIKLSFHYQDHISHGQWRRKESIFSLA